MTSIKVHIEGMVQGVGFRPFVSNLARKYGLKGWVKNGSSGVIIEASGDKKDLEIFTFDLKNKNPKNSRIQKFSATEIPYREYLNFQIKTSSVNSSSNIQITPDLGICRNCEEEIDNSKNRRFQYPFTTCLNCGPRYSIQRSLPL